MNVKDLIIERPQSQSFSQRWTSNSLTTLAWCFLFYAFLPLAGFWGGERALPALPFEYNITSMGAWGSLVPLLPWWALSAIGLIAVLYVWATVQFLRFRDTRRSAQRAPVTTAEMAQHCEHPESDVQAWGQARRAVAHYDSNARMVSVATSLAEPFREIPREGEPPAPTAPLATPAPARACAGNRRQQLEREVQALRTELVGYWGRIESLEALMRDVAESRDRRENNRDVVLFAQLKGLHGAMVARIKTTRDKLVESRYLLEEHRESETALQLRLN